MNIRAEVSLYPLRNPELSGPINRFCQALRKCDLDIEIGRMSTSLSGELVQVFDGLKLAMAEIGKDNDIVMVAKLSNACPSGSESVGKRLPPP